MDKYILFQDDYKSRKGIPALPFSRYKRSINKPFSYNYIENPKSIGDKIRNRRLEQCLFQKDVAAIIGVTEDCVTNWENNISNPETRYLPSIIKFLGYVPFEMDLKIFANRLQYCRFLKGLTHREMGRFLGVNTSTVGSWENNEHVPKPKALNHVQQLLGSVLKNCEYKPHA